MKHFLPALFFVACSTSLSAQQYKVDTIVNELWTNSAWVLSNRTVYTYNESCQLVSAIVQAYFGASWSNVQRLNYTYAGGDHISEVIMQQWNGSGWNNSSRTTYTYDGSFKVLTSVTQNWLAGNWSNSSRTTNTYDENGFLLSTLRQFSLGGSSWTNQTLDTYTNNADGTVHQWVNQNFDLATMSWRNYVRITYTYNADKTIQQEIEEDWNALSSSWENAFKISFTYDAQGRELTELTQTWQTNAWQNQSLITNTYNGNGQLTVNSNQEWDIDLGAWRDFIKNQYTYNGNGSLFQTIQQVSNENTNFVLENFSRSTYHYTTSCILPLTLLDFTASVSGKDVLLKWTTTREINTGSFEIQRSHDADNFGQIGSVKAAINSTQKISYQFVDANPSALATGKLYYRLKMVDRDGKFSYSNIASVGLPQGENSFTIFPTAVHDNLFVVFNSQHIGTAGLRIIDQAGRQVYRQQVKPVQTGNQLNINVSGLPAGSYYLELITNEGIRTSKFIKH